MLHGLRVAVIVPAHNEARFIRHTLRTIPGFIDRIYVVDDGSKDGTAEVARAHSDLRVEVVEHTVNQGVGRAIVSGYRQAFEGDADVAVVMAGDGQMDPSDLARLLEPLVYGEADYVKGNRLRYPRATECMPALRFLGNHLLSLLTRLATGLPVGDSQCGYTALSRAAADRLDLDRLWPRYGYPNDLLGRLATAGLRVRDVVVRPVYADEDSGIGWRHALVVIPWVLMRVWMRRIGLARSTLGPRTPARQAPAPLPRPHGR